MTTESEPVTSDMVRLAALAEDHIDMARSDGYASVRDLLWSWLSDAYSLHAARVELSRLLEEHAAGVALLARYRVVRSEPTTLPDWSVQKTGAWICPAGYLALSPAFRIVRLVELPQNVKAVRA